MPNLGTTSISGPVSIHTFHLPIHDHEIIVFGDQHFSYDNLCANPCNKPECELITAFIQRYVKNAKKTGKTLDVYVELPYVPKDLVRKSAQISKIEDSTRNNVASLEDFMDESDGREKEQQQRLGIIGHIFKVFGKHLYDEETKMIGNASNVRFHYADARFEKNTLMLIPTDVDRLVSSLDWDGSRLVRVLAAMIFGTDFGLSLPIEERRLVFPASLSTWRGRTVHKIAKQFLKLPAGMLKDRLRLYLDMRVNRVVPWVRQLRNCSRSDPESCKEIVIYIRSVLMDAYLLSRMIYYATQKQASKGVSIIYVGHAHAMEIVTFLREYAQMPPELCDTKQNINTDNVQRCVQPHPCGPSHSSSGIKRDSRSA
jgi:hypothetical protein